MKLEDMPTKELLALHNRIADKPADFHAPTLSAGRRRR